MPNRIIKESICTSDSLNSLSDFEENLFYKLIVNCDDYGLFDARPAILKSRCYPLRERLTLRNIEDALSSLARVGCVELYEVDGKPFLRLPTWEVHQQVRAKKPRFPAPDKNGYQLQSDDIKCPRNPIQSESESNNMRIDMRSDDFFELVWQLYPKKRGKGQVSDAQKKKLMKVGYDELARCIERYADSCIGKDEKYIQYGSTFFNSGYVDFLDKNYLAEESAPPPDNEDY